MDSQWRCAFPVRHIPIPREDVHFRWGGLFHCDSSHPHWEWGLWLTKEWGCASPGMHILTGNGHILYRVSLKSVLKIKWQKLKFKIMKIGMAPTKSYHHKKKILDCFHPPFLYVAKPPSLNLLFYKRLTWSQGRWNDSIFHNYNHWVDQYLSFVSDWNTGRLFLMKRLCAISGFIHGR